MTEPRRVRTQAERAGDDHTWRAAACALPEDLLGDGPCTDCGTVDNIVWFTDSTFWNAVVRQGDYVEPILCIPCFVKRTDAVGYWPTGWRLTPEFHWETHDEHTARKERSPDLGPPPVRCRRCPSLPYYAAEDFEGHVRDAHATGVPTGFLITTPPLRHRWWHRLTRRNP